MSTSHTSYEDLTAPLSNHSASSAVAKKMYYTYTYHGDTDDATPVAVPLNGSRIVASDGTELVFQNPRGKLRGTVLMLHGCSHSATDFFPSGESCPICIGLPEEIRMTTIALERGYSVIAVSSANRRRKCWATHPQAAQGSDYDRITTALREAQSRNAYSSHAPLFATGISSGGLFATSLPLRFEIAGVNSIVSSAVCLFWKHDANLTTTPYPAHVFTHMGQKDKATARRVTDSIEVLSRYDTKSIEFSISPKPVTERFLLDAVPRWSPDLVRRVVEALQKGGHLDEKYNLLSNPRHSNWRDSVSKLREELNDSLVPDESALSEELNKAWAAHEITADYFVDTMRFLEDKLRG